MTADLRNEIRTHIDQRARARRQRFIDAGELRVCCECGTDLDQPDGTIGCDHCKDRAHGRRRRQRPDYRDRERARSQRRRQLRAAA